MIKRDTQHFEISISPSRQAFFSKSPERAPAESQKPTAKPEPVKEKHEVLPAKTTGVPIDVEKNPEPEKGTAESVLKNKELFEAKNYSKDYQSYYINENPDNRAPWRFLAWRNQNEYRLLPESQREAYLKKHNYEIQSRYQFYKNAWEKMSPIMRAPRLRPSLTDRPELMVDKPVYAMGGSVSEGIEKNFRLPEGSKATIDYVPGADPATVLQNFERQIAKNTPREKLKGASAVISFDPELFGSKMPHKKYVEDTKQLLARLKELEMVVTVLSPLKTGNFDYTDVPAYDEKKTPIVGGDRDRKMAARRRNAYWDELGRFKEQGLITSLVDLGDATQSSDTLGTSKAFLSTEKGKLLNEKGNEMAVNGAILGINAAHGYTAGNLSNERYWPGGEDYALGKTTIAGKPVEGIVAGAPLLPESERKAALEKVKPDSLDALRRLDTDLMGRILLDDSHENLYKEYKEKRFIPGMYVFSYPAKRVVHEAFYALQDEKNNGKDVEERTREFSQLAASVYVKLARVAIIYAREIFEDPMYTKNRKEAYDHAKKYVQNAEEANSFYHLSDIHIDRLKKEWETFEGKFKQE